MHDLRGIFSETPQEGACVRYVSCMHVLRSASEFSVFQALISVCIRFLRLQLDLKSTLFSAPRLISRLLIDMQAKLALSLLLYGYLLLCNRVTVAQYCGDGVVSEGTCKLEHAVWRHECRCKYTGLSSSRVRPQVVMITTPSLEMDARLLALLKAHTRAPMPPIALLFAPVRI